MVNSKLDIAGLIKSLLHRSVRLIVMLFVILLIMMPVVDLSITCLLQEHDIVDSQDQTTTVSQSSSVGDPSQKAQQNSNTPLEIYQRILDITQNITIPLIGIAIPIVTFMVSLYEVAEKEKQQQRLRVHECLRAIFHHGASIEVVNQLRSPELHDKGTEGCFSNGNNGETDTPEILSFDILFPQNLVLPGRGFRIHESKMRFCYSQNDYVRNADGILYCGNPKEYAPALQYSIAISDAGQKERAKVFFYSDSLEGFCEITLKLMIDDWQNTEHIGLVKLFISKHKIDDAEKRKVICKVDQVSLIKVEHEKKRRNK